jgi:DNA-binding NtrC family response regulator
VEDIPALALHFAERFATETESPVPFLAQSFIERLQAYSWPGNIRELSNFMRRVLSLNRGASIDASCFDREFQPSKFSQHAQLSLPVSAAQAASVAMPAPGIPISVLEKMHLENTLALANGNRTHAAEMLGISLRTMRNKIREYGLPPRSYA